MSVSLWPRPAELGGVVLDAFTGHRLVGIGELHGLQDHHDALQLLLADPRLPEVADDVVVEFGNARYQDTMDRFVAGQPVADADLRVVWRNTTQSPRQTWDAPDASPSRAPDIQICTRLLLRVPIPTRVPNGGYANSHDCRVSCDLRSVDRRGAGRRSWGVHRLGRATDRRPAVAGQEAGGGHAQFAQACQDSASGIVDACGPKSPALTGWSGASPHVLRFPLRAFLRFPVCPPGSSPSPAVLWFPFVRRSPVRSLRPLPGSGSPSVSLRVPFPLSNLHLSAAVRRFPRRWSRAAGTNATSSTTPLGSRDPPARRMGSGWARWDAATESPVASGRERRTSPRPNCPDRPLLTRTCGLSPVRNVT